MSDTPITSVWLSQAREALGQQTSNYFTTHDTTGASLVLEWKLIQPELSSFAEKMQALSPLLTAAYVPVELQFSKTFPEALAQDWLLNPLAPLFQQGKKQGLHQINWNEVEEGIVEILHTFFTQHLVNNLSSNDVYILVTARETQTNKVVGVIFFSITSQFAHRTVRVPLFGILPTAQKRGLGKLLMSSIFTLIPSVLTIALSTRITNENALQMYRAIGFSETQSTIENWANLEYLVTNSDILQETARERLMY